MKLIKNAKLINGERIDILFNENEIIKVSSNIDNEGYDIISLEEDEYISSGWIDIHTHCYSGFKLYSGTPDTFGVNLGVSTVVDAGTCGHPHIDELYASAQNSITRTYAFLNASKLGIERQDELSDLNYLEEDELVAKFERYPNFLLGIKLRLSASVVVNNDVEPLRLAKNMQKRVNKPFMIHIGSNPPKLEDILNLLGEGDIVTHVYNGKANGILEDGKVQDFVFAARKRGVLFDIGHGSESFSFEVAQKAKADGFEMDSISTDIYMRNLTDGPVFDFATTMNKFLYLGYTKEKIIELVTKAPAEIVNLKNHGEIKEGYLPDFTIFKIDKIKHPLIDSLGVEKTIDAGFVPTRVIVKGELYEVK